MTLIYEPDLIILKMYLLARMNFLGQGFRKLEYYRHMNAREKITTQHSRAVKRLVTTRHDFVTAIKATRFVTSSHLWIFNSLELLVWLLWQSNVLCNAVTYNELLPNTVHLSVICDLEVVCLMWYLGLSLGLSFKNYTSEMEPMHHTRGDNFAKFSSWASGASILGGMMQVASLNFLRESLEILYIVMQRPVVHY